MLQAQEVSPGPHYYTPVVCPKRRFIRSESALGIFTILEEGQRLNGISKAQSQLNLQMHHHRSEH